MAEKLTIDFGNPLPLFPLPRCVLLPHATIPLHIFEERYKQMVNDVLDSHGIIAMAFFDRTAGDHSGGVCPPLRTHVCVGYVVRHDRLPSGRYNLLLQGVCRAAIRREVSQTPYRTALLEPVGPHAPIEADLSSHREALERLLGDPLLKQLASVSAIHNWLSDEIPTPALIDLAIMTICSNVEQRYAMLAESNAINRADWLERMLQDTRHTLVTAERFRQEMSADGVHLN